MNNLNTLNELASKDFNDRFLSSIYNAIVIGYDTYLRIVNENKSNFNLFGREKLLLGHLKTLSIEKSLDLFSMNNFSTYQSNIRTVTNQGHTALCIMTDKFLLNIFRTQKQLDMPSHPSKYRRNFAKANELHDAQLKFDFIDNNVKISNDQSLFALITYNFQGDEPSHIDIIVPNQSFTGILYHVNVLSVAKTASFYIPKDEKETHIINLQNEISKNIVKLKIR